jgi:hypothetical protein
MRTVITVIAVLLAAPAAGAQWSAPEPIAGHETMPNVAVRPDGEALGVWTGPGGGIEARVRTPAGAWGATQTLSSTPEPVRPVGAFTPDGTAWAAWTEGYYPGSVHVASRAPGGSFGPAQKISGDDPVTNFYVPVALAAGTDGTLAAAWIAVTGVNVTVVRVAVAPPGGAFGAPETISVEGLVADQQALFVDDHGRVVVAWTSNDGEESSVLEATRSAAGTWSEPLRLNAPGTTIGLLRFAGTPSGTAIATWSSLDEAPTPDAQVAVVAVTRDAAGTWSEPAELSGNGDGTVGLAMTADGRRALAWLDGGAAAGRLDPVLGSVAPAPVPEEIADLPWRGVRDLVVDAHGNALVVWGAEGPGANGALMVTPWQAGNDEPLPTEIISLDTAEGVPVSVGMDGSRRATMLWTSAAGQVLAMVREPVDDLEQPEPPRHEPDPPAPAPAQSQEVTPPQQTGPQPPPAVRACHVPRVLGRTPAAARRALVAAGCRAGKVRRMTTRRRSRRGRVLRQSPAAGAIRALGTPVALTVGRRPPRRG